MKSQSIFRRILTRATRPMRSFTKGQIAKNGKADLITVLNHEIRNPLSTLMLYVQMIERKAHSAGDHETRLWAKKANEQVRAIEMLAANYLNKSAVSLDTIPINKQHFPMETLLDSCVENLRLLYPFRRFDLITSGNALVVADRNRVEEVLHNLIANALKYSPEGTAIGIRCEREEEYVRVTVSNEGKGIAREEQHKLFDIYYRTRQSLYSKTAGLGMGLHIVKKIIEQHRGKTGVISNPGQGAQFYFTLPAGNASS